MSKQTAKSSAPPRYDDAFKQGAIQMVTEQKLVLSTFFRKFINLIHGKIGRELYPHHIHKDALYPCIFYNPIES